MSQGRLTNLVLTRKEGESIELYAGGELLGVITLHEIHQNFIRCGYKMNERIHVCRSEILEQEKIKAGVQRRKKMGIAKAVLVLATLLCCSGCIAPREMKAEARIAGQVVKVEMRK